MTKKLLDLYLDIQPSPVYIGPVVERDGCIVPLFVDTVPLMFWPTTWRQLNQELIDAIEDIGSDVIAGGMTPGVPLAAVVAVTLKKRFCWVRKEAKGYSQNRMVEGMIHPHDRVILIDDFFVRGKIKEHFIAELRRHGANVVAIAAVGIRHEAFTRQWARRQKVKLRYILTQREVTDEMVRRRMITPELRSIVGAFLQDPYGWHKDARRWQKFLEERERHKHLELPEAAAALPKDRRAL